jgi:protein tyrosine phosphatase type 4A
MAQASLAHKPSYIAHENRRFLIMDAPTDSNLPGYIEECKKHHVHTIVRACEPTYSTAPLSKAGINVVELPFPDGDPPPESVVQKWLDLCDDEFKKDETASMAVHCVAGLGRAPVLVVIALVELGMEPLDAVEFVRKKRRGALNSKQVNWLMSYKPRSKKKDCIIS